MEDLILLIGGFIIPFVLINFFSNKIRSVYDSDSLRDIYLIFVVVYFAGIGIFKCLWGVFF